MKKFLLLLALCLGVSIANAQVTGFYVDDGVVLSGNQWHYDNLSIVDAGSSNYLVITPNEYYYSYLPAFYTPTINYLIGDIVLGYRPYVRNGYLGWYVQARYGHYFVYQWANKWYALGLYSVPVYYSYSYNLIGMRYIDMRRWHFAPPPGPRPHHHHGTPPPHHGYNHGTPHHPNHHHGTPPPNNNHGGYVPGSQRGSGTTVRPANPPSNGNGSVRPSNPPSGGNRGTTVRPSGPPSGGSRSGGYTPGSSRSSGSSGGSVSRPPSGSRGSAPSRSSGGSTRRR